MSDNFIEHEDTIECTRCHRHFGGKNPYRNFCIHWSHAHAHANPDPSLSRNALEGAETRSIPTFELGMTPSAELIVKSFELGYTTPDLAWTWEVSNGKMAHHIRVLGLSYGTITEAKLKKSNALDDTLLLEDRLRKLYVDDRLSTYEIAELCGRNRDAVVRALHRFGIHVRRSAPVTWSHKLLIRKIREQGIKVDEFQINYQATHTRYMIDIAFPEIKLGIEIDGRSHFEDQDGYYGARKQYDLERDAELTSLGWKMVHYTDQDVRYTLRETVDDVLSQIRILIQEREASLIDVEDDDIVRYSEEIRRDEDKEPHSVNNWPSH
jgi:very-short-patch-repair endonuclease